MMRLSCTSLSLQRAFHAGHLDVPSFLEFCREIDLDGVDLNTATIPTHDLDYLREVKLRALRLGLSIVCVSIGNDFGKHDAQADAEVEMVKSWIDRALLLGAPQVRVFAGTVPKGEERATAWQRAACRLKVVADYGYSRGIQVALQNHDHGALAGTGDEVLRFIAQAGPHLGHVWDTGQYVGSPGASGAAPGQGAQETLYQSLQQTVHLATLVRAKIYRIEGGVERWLDYPRIVAMLRAARYNGFCSIVYEGPGDEFTAVRQAAAYLRPLLAASPSR